jgi:hypothetical protein
MGCVRVHRRGVPGRQPGYIGKQVDDYLIGAVQGEDVTRPQPDSAADRARVDEQSLRRRLLESSHREDVVADIASFFDPLIASTMTINPDLSANPMAQVVEQVCTAYDEPPAIRVDGNPDLSLIITPELWPLMQEVNRLAEGARECLQRLDWIDGEIAYRNVPADCILWARAGTGKKTNSPVGLCELVERYRPDGSAAWTRETWSAAPGVPPVFRIEEWADTKWVDATATWYTPGPGQDSYPYMDADGPIFPYILNHARVGNGLWSWRRGKELAAGTLRAATHMTHWCDGFADAAHPQRYGIDVEVQGARTRQVNGTRVSSVPTDRKSILLFTAKKDGASLGQFQAAMDPLSSFQSIQLYIQQLAIFAGLSPGDLQSVGAQSGHAIYVSREGQRRAQRAQQPALRLADQQRLATAARLANAYGGAKLPTDPKAYGIAYAELSKSLEEKRADLEEIKMRKENGLASDVDALRVFEPHLTDEQAAERLVDIARTQALLDAAKKLAAPGTAATTPGDDVPPPSGSPPPTSPGSSP